MPTKVPFKRSDIHVAEEKFTKHLLVRLPTDVRNWLKAEAERNLSTQLARSFGPLGSEAQKVNDFGNTRVTDGNIHRAKNRGRALRKLLRGLTELAVNRR